MRVLVVGGTGFLGAAAARAVVRAGHDVTVLTRGGKPVTEGAGALVADRMDLPDLRGQFDAVIDTCAYIPGHVDRLRDALGAISQYVIVSSISAYDDLSEPGADETAPASPATAAQVATHVEGLGGVDAAAYGADYGPLKRSCELRALDWVPGAALIRLGLIVGPEDYMDRFTWWLRRLDEGGTVPVPEGTTVQLIDVEDAGQFLAHLLDNGTGGALNVTGDPMPLRDMLDAINKETGAGTILSPRPLHAFVDAEVAFWSDLPMVVPPDAKAAGMLQVKTDRAKAAGLTTRPLEETIRATLAWDRSRRDKSLACGMSPTQEAAVLAG